MRIIRTIIFCTCVVVSLTGTAFSAYRDKKHNIAYETHEPLFIELSQNLFEVRPQSLALELPDQGYASLKQYRKLASVYFLTSEKGLEFETCFGDDCGGGITPTPGKKCKDEGYTLETCATGTPADFCPYNHNYFRSCNTCDSSYQYTSCDYPLTLSSDSCGGKYKCVCDTTLYPVTASSCAAPMVPASGDGSSCTANGETRYSECVCPSSYTETCTAQNMQGKGTGCTKNGETLYAACECKPGYNLTCSGDGNSPVKPTDYCLKDGIKYYDNCNSCPFRCTIAEADKQPGIAYEYEECSKKYCDIGCATGYIDWCEKPETDCATLGYTKSASQCANGYLKCPYNSAAVFCEDEVCSVENCVTCVAGQSDSCEVCKDGYHTVEALTGKKVCRLTTPVTSTCNVANCQTCASGSSAKCEFCKIGYTLSNGTCVAACNVANCTTCVSGNSAQCSICASGYILQDGLCVSASLPTEPIDGCPLNTTPQICNGQEYCCPAGVSCLSSSGSIRCYMKNPDVGGGLL